jgi:tetratricopeptide (TPR) repeat protein
MVLLLLFLFADQFDTTFHAGLVALNQNNLAVAESQLELASRVHPDDSRVWLALAQTYWRLHKPQPAQAAARNAEAHTDDPAILRGLALYYSEAADPAKAAGLLRQVIQRRPYEESSYFDLAQLDLKMQDFAGALETSDAGLRYFDKSAQLELAAGVAYYGLRRFGEAIDAFLRVNRLDADAEQPYVFLGRMLDQAEDKLPEITRVFAAFEKRAPDSYLSNFLYGKALLREDATEQAEALLRKSIRENDSYWESHFELGVLLDQRGKYAEAASEIRRGIELNPDDPMPHYHLARLYDRLGRTAEAREERRLHGKLSAGGSGMAGIK